MLSLTKASLLSHSLSYLHTSIKETGLNGGRKDTSHPHSRASSASSQQVANGFGPIRVTDNEIPGGSVNVIHRRYNSSSTSETILPGGPKIVPHNQSPPTLWFNRTWHWSTNRTREYDPDLDGTTLPSVEDIEIMPPPIREPYDITFPWGSLSPSNFIHLPVNCFLFSLSSPFSWHVSLFLSFSFSLSLPPSHSPLSHAPF